MEIKLINKTPLGSRKRFRLSYRAQRNIAGWLIFLPTVLILLLLTYRPIIEGIRLSFYETKGFSTVRFSGLDNYCNVLMDNLFMKALINMVKYEFWSVLMMITPFVMAIAVNEERVRKSL